MTLFIQTDNTNFGAGNVFPDRAGSHLIAICLDTGYDEAAPVGNQIQVIYNRTENGIPAQRLDTLVNTDFPGTAGTTDIIVVAVDELFTLNDGSLVVNNAGLTIPPGTPNNPTASVLVIYDTSNNGGDGICVAREGSGDLDLEFPASALLYHELSHALRFCTSSLLDTTEPDCEDASDEEAAAIADENDMRDQIGITRRQADNHCGDIGCDDTCCIVASISCGSPFAAEVNSLRHIRDRFLRKSEVGFEFFDSLHSDYYKFSPQVCGIMGDNPELRAFIRDYFVRGLVASLQLTYGYTADARSASELGEMFEGITAGWPQLTELGPDDLRDLRAILKGPAAAPAALGLNEEQVPRVNELAGLLEQWAQPSEHVQWALVDVLLYFIDALELRAAGAGSAAIGEQLAASIDAWSVRMPIGEVWTHLSRYELKAEIDFLERALLRSPQARREFMERLAGRWPDNQRLSEVIAPLLAEEAPS